MPYCETCQRGFHPLGIMRHRAMHRDKKEDCEIRFLTGTYKYNYSEQTSLNKSEEAD